MCGRDGGGGGSGRDDCVGSGGGSDGGGGGRDGGGDGRGRDGAGSFGRDAREIAGPSPWLTTELCSHGCRAAQCRCRVRPPLCPGVQQWPIANRRASRRVVFVPVARRRGPGGRPLQGWAVLPRPSFRSHYTTTMPTGATFSRRFYVARTMADNAIKGNDCPVVKVWLIVSEIGSRGTGLRPSVSQIAPPGDNECIALSEERCRQLSGAAPH